MKTVPKSVPDAIPHSRREDMPVDMWTIGLCPNACASPASMLKAGKCSASPTYPPAPATNHFLKLDLKEGEGSNTTSRSAPILRHGDGRDEKRAYGQNREHRFIMLRKLFFLLRKYIIILTRAQEAVLIANLYELLDGSEYPACKPTQLPR